MSSANDWKQCYFLGVTPRSISQMPLSQAHIQALLSMVNIPAGIATDFIVDPRFIINSKGVTVWLALYAFLATTYPVDLEAARKQEASLFLPASVLSGSFGNHNNWPKPMLQKYELDLSGCQPFIIPFLISAAAPAPSKMVQSLKAPDGSLEIVGVHVFDENDPEMLLKESDAALKWWRNERNS